MIPHYKARPIIISDGGIMCGIAAALVGGGGCVQLFYKLLRLLLGVGVLEC